MEWYIGFLLGAIGSLISMFIGYQISEFYRKEEARYLWSQIYRLENPLKDEADEEPVTAPKFRIRTLQSDPRRHSRVVSARLRAKKNPSTKPRR